MTASVQIHCDAAVDAYGTCPTRIVVLVQDVDAARAAARQQGWLTTRDGSDRCPHCVGRPR